MTIRPYKVQQQQSSGQCAGLRVGPPGFQSWPRQGIVPLRCAGKKKCELCFQAWLNLYIASAVGLWVTYIQTYIYLKFLVFKTCPDAFLFASSSIFFCTLARVGYFLYQMNKKNKNYQQITFGEIMPKKKSISSEVIIHYKY